MTRTFTSGELYPSAAGFADAVGEGQPQGGTGEKRGYTCRLQLLPPLPNQGCGQWIMTTYDMLEMARGLRDAQRGVQFIFWETPMWRAGWFHWSDNHDQHVAQIKSLSTRLTAR